jgi:hypothetical protein
VVAVFAALTARRQRYLVAHVDTTTGVERIARTLEWDASPARVRELVGEAADGWDHGVLVADPEPGTRVYVLPHIEGVVTRWDELVRAHRQHTLLDMAARAVTAMGERSGPDTDALAQWVAAGARDEPPAGGAAFVPPAREPVTDGEWFAMERRAQLLARVLPIAAAIDPDRPTPLALQIVAGLVGR